MNSLTVAFFFKFTVQHECIPQAILGMDILCQAKSGMGKTAVFVLATLQQIEPVDGQVSWLLFLFTMLSLGHYISSYMYLYSSIMELFFYVKLDFYFSEPSSQTQGLLY